MDRLAPAMAKASRTGFACLALAITSAVTADPPFQGTVHDIGADIVTDADPTSFLSLECAGRGLRTVFDRRPNA